LRRTSEPWGRDASWRVALALQGYPSPASGASLAEGPSNAAMQRGGPAGALCWEHAGGLGRASLRLPRRN